MLAMIKNSQNHKFNDKINVVPYKLDSKSMKRPTKFELTFILNKRKYVYGFSCTKDKIIEEYLKGYSSNGSPRKFFNRKNTKDFTFTKNKPRQNRIKEETNGNQLYLSKMALQNYEELKPIYGFLTENMAVGTNQQWGIYTKNKLNEDLKFRKWALEILKKGDFGGILDIETKIKEREVNGFEFQIGETPSVKKADKNKEEYLDIKFVHKNEKGQKVLFEELEESIGTLRTFNMLGPIYDILTEGMIVFIDEFEINLHPEITRFLIKLFHSKHNKKNGQIIFTTHDTTLLRAENVFRRDQIYFTEKKPNENTTFHSLMDYKLREGIDFQNAYLNGRVGGMPFVDESYI